MTLTNQISPRQQALTYLFPKVKKMSLIPKEALSILCLNKSMMNKMTKRCFSSSASSHHFIPKSLHSNAKFQSKLTQSLKVKWIKLIKH